ncbi:hypothetical protein GCM10011389_31150 [Pontibacillus salipaludis]|uniref:Uncharacterized protein n=1 Tax=Pontibacillus salipaludis TaxID=1697394 RepID=A0ABQ1QCB3_9BACI|nr:hypothetical protein GCM10011389_31150 [Pontibacillus salipaludis]
MWFFCMRASSGKRGAVTNEGIEVTKERLKFLKSQWIYQTGERSYERVRSSY